MSAKHITDQKGRQNKQTGKKEDKQNTINIDEETWKVELSVTQLKMLEQSLKEIAAITVWYNQTKEGTKDTEY